MTHVQFEDGEQARVEIPRARKQTALTKLVIKLGLAKTYRGAQIALLVLALIFILVTVYINNQRSVATDQFLYVSDITTE